MTAHTLGIFLLNASPIALGIIVYVLWIRPTIRNLPHIKEFYDEADSRWQAFLIWLRVQWDIVVSTFLMLWPQIPDLLQGISGADMSALIPSETTKVINQVIGLLLLVLRAFTIAKTRTPPAA